MILVIGGSFQGKRDFAAARFAAGRPVDWTDGAKASLEEMLEAEFICRFHRFAERLLRGEIQADCEELARLLRERRPDRVVISDETGCEIVPMDRQLRMIREETGRLLCRMARESEQVWRVTCGIGQRIK